MLGLAVQPRSLDRARYLRLLLASSPTGWWSSLSAGLLILALSSLSRNSRYVALFWLGIWFVSAALWLASCESSRSANNGSTQVATASVAQSTKRGVELRGFAELEMEAAKTNWRPLVSYTANLSRIGQELLRTDAAGKRLSDFNRPARREPSFCSLSGPQYPWYWSAARAGRSLWTLRMHSELSSSRWIG